MEMQTETQRTTSDVSSNTATKEKWNREVIEFTTEEKWKQDRSKDVTSTEGLSLFGHDQYTPLIELWHRKAQGIIPDFKGNKFTKAGTALEPAIAKLAADEHGWEISRDQSYFRIPELRAGTSMDFWIDNLEEPTLLEIKNVGINAFNEWSVDDQGNAEAPLRYEMQVQWEMFVTGVNKCFLAALVGGNELVVLEREADLETHKAIAEKLKWFWSSIESNTPPEVNFDTDSDWIIGQLQHSEPGKIYDGESDDNLTMLANDYKVVTNEEKELSKKKKAIKAQILELIGDSEKAKGNGFTVSAGTIGPTEVPATTRKAYRNFRVNWRKSK